MRKDAILVYQMAKVGSSTVVASLKASPFNGFICHTHFLSEKGLQFLTNSFEKTYDSLDECPSGLSNNSDLPPSWPCGADCASSVANGNS